MTFKKRLNEHVMTASFREGLRQAYANALAKLDIPTEEIRPHIIGSATVVLTDVGLEILRTKYGEKMLELSPHSNSGAIEIFLPEGEAYLKKNRPTMTDEERQAKNAPKGSFSREAAQKRKETRAALRERLKALHNIDLDGGEPDTE